MSEMAQCSIQSIDVTLLYGVAWRDAVNSEGLNDEDEG